MYIRIVNAGEIDLFIKAAGSPDHQLEVREYLDRMFAAGSMRPEWCFVAEGDVERPLGRVAFWTLPGMEEPFALVLIDVADGDYAGVGRSLLRHVLEEARALGAGEIEHVVDDPPMPPQFQNNAQKRIELLEDVGFTFRRATGRFEWQEGEPPTTTGRLSFRTLPDVGEDTFVEAMMKVSEGTLDQEIREERERLGAKPAARDFFDDARRVEHDPSWWRLAYSQDGQLVGLVMPAEPPGFLTIFYVGVVPAMRGRGYVDDLLASGTATLLEARNRGGNEKPLRADTDVANAPMAAAFERTGWARFAGRHEYIVDLAMGRA